MLGWEVVRRRIGIQLGVSCNIDGEGSAFGRVMTVGIEMAGWWE